MLERILNFLKNKYFIGTVVLLFVIAIVVLVINFNSLEFLYLKSSGHRRAIHKWDDGYSSSWLVP